MAPPDVCEEWDVRRRSFLSLLGVTAGGVAVVPGATATESGGKSEAVPAEDGQLSQLSFYSSASQIAPDGESELTDDDVVVVWANPAAENFETTADGPETVVYENADVPLVSEDGPVVGFGSVDFVADDNGGFRFGNEQFLLNLFDEKIGGEGVVLWDEGHDQFTDLALEHYESFRQYASDYGYQLNATESLLETGVSELRFPSTASLVDTDGTALTNPEYVVVWAESSAENVDEEGDDAYIYGADEDVPLIAKSGPVAGIGTVEFVADDEFDTFTEANAEFVGSLLGDLSAETPADDESAGDTPTVLWDEAHDSYWDADSVTEFGATIEDAGYVFEAVDDLLDDGEIGELEFFSTASLLDADRDPLTDEDLVAVWAEPTATNEDASEDDDGNASDDDGNGSADDGFVPYPEDVDVPLVAVDGPVVGIGAELATDESDVDANREFLVNAWTDRLDGTGTVVYDESHDQSLSLAEYADLRALAEDRGFTVEATDALAADLADADLVMITTPGTAFDPDTRDALADFVADGGVLFVHDEANFEGDATAELNELAEALDLAFRFNADQVVDEEHSGFAPFVPRTSNVNEDVEFFEGAGAPLERAAVLGVASPDRPYTAVELAALSDFVDDGGGLLLFDESEFVNEETDHLNEIAEALDLPFRFNADQVEDPVRNAGQPFVPTTSNFNTGFEYFGEADGPTLADGDALVVTTPEASFTDAELDALEEFVADGGALFLFDQSDFGGQDNDQVGFDETANLNEIAEALDLAFRFNSDQVNEGDAFDIVTENLNTDFPYFAARDRSIAVRFHPDEAYYGRVVRVFDGDTFEVEFDSEYDYRDVVRHIGMDTAETPPAENDPEEWFGIPDDAEDHLVEWGERATQFSLDVMAPEAEAGETGVDGRRVKLTFDADEPMRGNYGRLLSYMHYDPEDFDADSATGDFSVTYNEEAVAEGYARIYSSGFSKHDEWAHLEEAALADGKRIWSATDFDALEEIRNDPVERVFVPRARSVRSSRGRRGRRLDDDRVALYAAETAEQDLGEDGVAVDDPALVGVDEHRRTALVGGITIHERYEDDEFPFDAADYGNFAFLANLFETLSNATGDVIIAGGQGQFNAPGSISLERCELFLRYLEGVGLRLRQFNDLPTSLPAEEESPRAILLTAPARELEIDEIIALRRARNDGTAVVLLGSAATDDAGFENLNALAQSLNTDLRFNDDRVVDETANVADDPTLLETDRFGPSFDLTEPYEPTGVDDGDTDDGHPGRRSGG